MRIMSGVVKFQFSCRGSYALHFKQFSRHVPVKGNVTSFQKNNVKMLRIPEPQLDIDRYCDPTLTEYFSNNIKNRKGVGNIQRVVELSKALMKQSSEVLRRDLVQEALKIPNETHPQSTKYGNTARVLKTIGHAPENHFKPKGFDELMEHSNQFRMKELSPLAGHKAYYLSRELAEIEHALIRYVVQYLTKRGFSLISVPDVLHHQIIECCGMSTRGERSIVYRLDGEKHLASAAEGELCLSGTAEMAMGGFLMNQNIPMKELPRRYVAVSRCYRAETAEVAAERGLYRVHQFSKVEMFGVCNSNQSEGLLEEFRAIQEEIFSSFGLYLQVLDMPPNELGASAYKKYDIEAWLPSRKTFGEVSSCSNCTDYQTRRLNIKCSVSEQEQDNFAHTVNGTACAIPRLIMAICETHQQEDGSIKIPKLLQPYMFGKDKIVPENTVTKFFKKGNTLLKQVGVEE